MFNKSKLYHEGLIEDFYIIEQDTILGEGASAIVRKGIKRDSGESYAIKIIDKTQLGENELESLYNELKVMSLIDHPNIVRVYEYYECHGVVFIVMELMNGGELFDKIVEYEHYTEKQASEAFRPIVDAVRYCHKLGIVHRDLKPENLLYLKEGEEEDNPIKIADFGLSQHIDINKTLSSKVGTAYYVPPEILAGKYNEKCDIWSAGVILYILLSGDPPFNASSDNLIYAKIRKIDYSFPDDKWKHISKEAKDLISKMLIKEDSRLSASQVLEHPWFNLLKDEKISLQNLHFGKENFFKEYSESNLLKKIMLLYIASKLEESEILDLKKLFKGFDKDNNGQIDYKEFEKGLMELNTDDLNQEEIKKCFDEIDVDHSGKIDYTEFIAASLERRVYLKKEKLFEAFSSLDKDKNCQISKDELMKILKLEPKEDPFVAKLINLADKNGDGNIDYKEFLQMMGYNN